MGHNPSDTMATLPQANDAAAERSHVVQWCVTVSADTGIAVSGAPLKTSWC